MFESIEDMFRDLNRKAGVTYQLLPDLTIEEYGELRDDIREHGIRVPVDVDENGNVLDGHHRVRIAEELGYDYDTRVVEGLTDEEKREHALAVNVHRRQLSRDQKRELVKNSLRADPDLTDREHARRTNVNHETVAARRSELEESGEIRHFPSRADPRTGRPSQPAQKPAQHECSDCGEVFPKPSWHCQGCGEHYAVGQVATCPKCHPEPMNVDSETGEILSTPEPTTQPARKRTTNRRPLTDRAKDAGWDLRKNAEKVERIVDDDRFTHNKTEVAAHLRGHLTYTVEVCQDLLNRLTN